MDDGLKSYSLMDIVRDDHITNTTVSKKSDEYIPVKFEDAGTRTRHKRGHQKKPYTIKYIKTKDLKRYFKQKAGKELVFKGEEEKTPWQSKERLMKGTNKK